MNKRITRQDVWFKICRICALIWIYTFPVAIGTIVMTGGDFALLGVLLEQPHVQEHRMIIKTLINVGLNLHIGTAIPSAFAFINLTNNNTTK